MQQVGTFAQAVPDALGDELAHAVAVDSNGRMIVARTQLERQRR